MTNYHPDPSASGDDPFAGALESLHELDEPSAADPSPTSPPAGADSAWWRDIEDAFSADSETGPDPWAHVTSVPEVSGLTADQLAFLDQLAAQPHVGRLDDTDFDAPTD